MLKARNKHNSIAFDPVKKEEVGRQSYGGRALFASLQQRSLREHKLGACLQQQLILYESNKQLLFNKLSM